MRGRKSQDEKSPVCVTHTHASATFLIWLRITSSICLTAHCGIIRGFLIPVTVGVLCHTEFVLLLCNETESTRIDAKNRQFQTVPTV